MTPNKKKIIIIVIIAIILGVILYFILRKPKPAALPSGSTPVNPDNFPLKIGSTGTEVKAVQKYLNDKYSAGLVVDGSWGPATDAAVQKYLNRDNVSQAVYDKWNLS